MQRPTTISVTTVLMAAFLVWGIVGAFITPLPAIAIAAISATMLSTMVHASAIFFSLVAAVFVFFYWRGDGWARWLVMIDCIFVLLGLIKIKGTFEISHQGAALTLLKCVLAIYLLWYLNSPEGKAWFAPRQAAPLPPSAWPPAPTV